MSPRRSVFAFTALAATLGLTACGDEAPKGAAPTPDLTGKADVADHVVVRGALPWGDEPGVTGAFVEDLSYEAWTLAVRPGAELTLDVTRKGSSSKLDTTLFVFGPRDAQGSYGTTALAFDDDAGWGRLSRLTDLTLAAGGEYLVVLGTADGRGRGAYRLVARCAAADCAPVPVATGGACPAPIAAAITACVEDWLADPDHDPSTTTRVDLLEQCADAEVVAPAWDAMCASAGAPSTACGASLEAFATGTLPRCRVELTHATLDAACVFGERYRDLWYRADATVVLWSRTLDTPEGLSALEAEQIVRAVHETAHDEVTTVEEAFAAVDEGLVHQTAVWDASGRRSFMVYEVGAGDNSFGAYFAHGTLDVVARNGDGDLYDCAVTWGPERRACASDDECAEGLRCNGRPQEIPRGRCLDPHAVEHAASGEECVGVDGCPAGAGLVCAGAVYEGQGLCRPAWMRARFNAEVDLEIPDANAAGVEAQVLAYGLATVDVEVVLDL